MKIILINKDDKTVMAEYESPVAPCKHDLITVETKKDVTTVKVDQVEHFVRENRMARRNEIGYIGVTVKPVINAI